MTRAGFWSESVRVWLIACGRQDLVDRGDALAQRVAALLLSVRQRVDQYLENDDLYNGRGGSGIQEDALSGDPARSISALSEIEDFVNVRLLKELLALEAVLAVFDDLRSRTGSDTPFEVCERLNSSIRDENIAGFAVGGSSGGILAMTVIDPGPGVHDLCVDGVPFSVTRAPRSVRRRMFSGQVR